MNKPIFYCTFLGCFLQMLSPLLATTYINEAITTKTTWTKEGSPYILLKNVVIQANSSLVIEEGAVVLFSEYTQLIVAGNLLAKGTAQQPILFGGQDALPWKGILFYRTCNDYNPSTGEGVKLEHCIFKGSQKTMNALLQAKGCDLMLLHCELDNCHLGLQTERQTKLWLEHSTIKNCQRALNIQNTSIAHIQHNKFLNCNSILLGGTTLFQHNVLKRFTSEGRHSGLIVWMLGGGKVTLSHNQFQKFEDYVLKVYKLTQRSSVVVEKNDFKNNPVNLKLSCQYYNTGTVQISQNNFHNYRRHHVQVYGSCEDINPITIAIGPNYWGNLSLEDLQLATVDQEQDPVVGARVLHSPPLEEEVKLE